MAPPSSRHKFHLPVYVVLESRIGLVADAAD